jgi:hypothetical protein
MEFERDMKKLRNLLKAKGISVRLDPEMPHTEMAGLDFSPLRDKAKKNMTCKTNGFHPKVDEAIHVKFKGGFSAFVHYKDVLLLKEKDKRVFPTYTFNLKELVV